MSRVEKEFLCVIPHIKEHIELYMLVTFDLEKSTKKYGKVH